MSADTTARKKVAAVRHGARAAKPLYPSLKPWNAAVACGACGTRLIPLSYPLPPRRDPHGEERPDLRCYRCGQRHRWADSGGWFAVGSHL